METGQIDVAFTAYGGSGGSWSLLGEQLRGENDVVVVVVSILPSTNISVKPNTDEDILKDNCVTHFCPLKQ